MGSRILRIFVAAMAAGLSLASCSEPRSNEQFVRADQASDGVYVFTVPLTDSLAVYDFSFYSRTGVGTIHSLEMRVQWLAPSGDSMAETVYMSEVGPKGNSEIYRSGVVPAEYGDWKISVRPVGVDSDFTGLGLITERRDGTR